MMTMMTMMTTIEIPLLSAPATGALFLDMDVNAKNV